MTYIEAFKILWQGLSAIFRNLGRDINKFVKRFTWSVIVFIALSSIAISYGAIGKARTERDILQEKNMMLSKTCDSLKLFLKP